MFFLTDRLTAESVSPSQSPKIKAHLVLLEISKPATFLFSRRTSNISPSVRRLRSVQANAMPRTAGEHHWGPDTDLFPRCLCDHFGVPLGWFLITITPELCSYATCKCYIINTFNLVKCHGVGGCFDLCTDVLGAFSALVA